MHWEVTLCWYGENHTLKCVGLSKDGAVKAAQAGLAKQLGRSSHSVRQYFLATQNTIEAKRKEDS